MEANRWTSRSHPVKSTTELFNLLTLQFKKPFLARYKVTSVHTIEFMPSALRVNEEDGGCYSRSSARLDTINSFNVLNKTATHLWTPMSKKSAHSSFSGKLYFFLNSICDCTFKCFKPVSSRTRAFKVVLNYVCWKFKSSSFFFFWKRRGSHILVCLLINVYILSILFITWRF